MSHLKISTAVFGNPHITHRIDLLKLKYVHWSHAHFDALSSFSITIKGWIRYLFVLIFHLFFHLFSPRWCDCGWTCDFHLKTVWNFPLLVGSGSEMERFVVIRTLSLTQFRDFRGFSWGELSFASPLASQSREEPPRCWSSCWQPELNEQFRILWFSLCRKCKCEWIKDSC